MHLHLQRRLRLWRREARPTLALALPIVAGMVSQMVLGIADAMMVGRVGVVPLAAASFVNAIAHLSLVFGLGLLSAIAVRTSQAYGARRPDEAGEILRHGLVLSLVTGILAALAIVALYPWLNHFGQTAEVVAASGPYLLLFGASLFPALVAHGCKQFSEALKHPWLPNFVMLGGVVLNIFLNWVFIYGNWGAPALGLAGAGWATLIARSLMAVVLVVYVLRARVLRPFQPKRWQAGLSREQFRSLLRIGWPVGVQHFFEVGAFALAAIMMGWISADAIAAHQIAISCAALTFMSALGIGAAAGIRVGHAYGAGQFARMRRIGFGGVALAALTMGSCGLVFALGGRPIAAAFIAAPNVVALTAQLLVVAAVFQIADGIQVSSIAALRGLADVRVPALVAVFAYWLVALPLGAGLAFGADWGPVGIWTGLAVGLGVAAVCLAWRFHQQTRGAIAWQHGSAVLTAVAEHGSLP